MQTGIFDRSTCNDLRHLFISGCRFMQIIVTRNATRWCLASISHRHRRLMMFQSPMLSLTATNPGVNFPASTSSFFSDRPIPAPDLHLSVHSLSPSQPPNSSTPISLLGPFHDSPRSPFLPPIPTFPSLPLTPSSLLVHALVDKKVM